MEQPRPVPTGACAGVRSLGSGLFAGLLLALAGAGSAAAQQTGVLAGTVLDRTSGSALAGVQVSIVGSGIGALTDEAGAFRLDPVPAGTHEVRVESLGYETVTESVTLSPGQTLTLAFTLAVSAVSLDEMVITVTGLQRRREVGNATTTLPVAEELETVLPPGLLGLLQGRAPGVQVLQSSGSVGSTPTITIRGNSSFLLDDTPIVYVDGTRVANDLRSGPAVGGQTTSRLSDLNLDDIESIEIVNGPSAATLYGSEAAAGVIRITTKRGRAGTSEWTFQSEMGANWDASEWPIAVWNPRSFYGEAFDLALLLDIEPGQLLVPVPDTLYTLDLLGEGAGDAYGNPWRTGLERLIGASVRGGAGNVTYFLSGELVDRRGNLENNEVTRRGLRANLTLTPSARTRVQVSTGFSSNAVSLPDNDDSAFGYIGIGLLGSPWLAPVEREDPVVGGTASTCPDAIELQRALLRGGIGAPLSALAGYCARNPFYEGRTFEDVATIENDQDVERFTGSVTVTTEPWEFLEARGTLGYDQFSDRTSRLIPVDPERPFQDLSLGFRSVSSLLVRGLTLDGILNARFDATDRIETVTSVGAQLFGTRYESAASLGRTLPPGINTVSSAVRREGFESTVETRTLGVFAQQQIGWRDRLFVTPGVRVDQSSTFGEDETRAVYPRISASWVASEESWFPRVPLLETLFLRGALGWSGKQPSPYAAIQQLGSRAVTYGGQDVSGVVLEAAGNPDLRPERGEEIELGFDAVLLDRRLDLRFTWFRQLTRDALVERLIAPSSGYALGQIDNVGEVRNAGMELSLDAAVLSRPGLTWDLRLNLGTLDSEITELDEPIVFGFGDNSQRHQQGHPFGSYFARTYSVRNGEVVRSDSAVYVGQPSPEYAGSILSTVGISDWLQLSAVLGFAGGHQVYNATEQRQCSFFGGGPYGGVCTAIYEVDGNGQRTEEARIKATAAREISIAPWIEDADFTRLRSLSARIELPPRLLRLLRAERGSFTLSGENLALFTRYSGVDPEVNYAGGGQTSRAEFFTLPLARRVVGRVALTF